MSGIDKIIERIRSDTDAVCDSILSASRSNADAVIAEAQAEADELLVQCKKNTAARVADIKKRGESAAELEEKRVMLYTKQKIISQMLASALDTVKNKPDAEYFDMIEKMVAKYSQSGDGVIVFGEKDLRRLPAGFIDRLNKVSKGSLTLSAESADIDSGFILKYGGIEENCSFDAIFAGEYEYLSDRAGRLLF